MKCILRWICPIFKFIFCNLGGVEFGVLGALLVGAALWPPFLARGRSLPHPMWVLTISVLIVPRQTAGPRLLLSCRSPSSWVWTFSPDCSDENTEGFSFLSFLYLKNEKKKTSRPFSGSSIIVRIASPWRVSRLNMLQISKPNFHNKGVLPKVLAWDPSHKGKTESWFYVSQRKQWDCFWKTK